MFRMFLTSLIMGSSVFYVSSVCVEMNFAKAEVNIALSRKYHIIFNDLQGYKCFIV